MYVKILRGNSQDVEVMGKGGVLCYGISI